MPSSSVVRRPSRFRTRMDFPPREVLHHANGKHRRCEGHRRDFLPHTRAKKLPRAAEYLVYSLTPSRVLAENHPKNRGFVGILRGQKCRKRGQKCLKRRGFL